MNKAEEASKVLKKKVTASVDELQEQEQDESSDEEIFNAVNQYHDGISLSIYDDKNMKKKEFQKQYYGSPPRKGKDPALSRAVMVHLYQNGDADSRRHFQHAMQPKSLGNKANESTSYGLKLSTQLGNISGLHIDDDESKFFKLPKNTLISNMKAFEEKKEELAEAIEEAKVQAAKKIPKKKDKKQAQKKPVEETEEESPRPPGEPRECTILRELNRTERFEARMKGLNEINDIHRHLAADGVNLSADTLHKAICFPEDEEEPENFRENRIALITHSLQKNPAPKTKKKGKKKK